MTQILYDEMINSKVGFGQMMLRDILIPSILGNETNGILYWAGKDIARKLPVATDVDLVTLFQQLGFGTLNLIKKNNKYQQWELSGDEVINRAKLDQASFNLEAGFIAQQIEFQTNALTEAEVEVQKKKVVKITVHHDFANEVINDVPVEFITLKTTE